MLKIIGNLLLLITATVSFPPYPANTDCDGVTCIPNPGNCQPSYEKDTCCPVWYCQGLQGGVFTSFGNE
ncbi:unnamed protein product [Allacma fusca]|uniref:Uncharacterized protein n=1 Tax=Allacma fusca TaxID=39272 RepID=A0A8J2JTG6_9HEXA|nr:unnamed protein product [Allacma fusca]